MALPAMVEALEREADALYDDLTGLPGPLLARAHLHHALRRALRNRTQVAVLALDVDGVTDLGRRTGRAVADEVLVVLAARIQAALRGTDVTARIEDRRFLVVCEDVTDDHDVAMIARRLADVARTRMRLGEAATELRVSLGTALGTGADTPAELVRLAAEELRQALRLQRRLPSAS